MRVSIAALAVVALAQLASATFTPTKPGNSCKKTEFWYEDKKCCIPSGGPPKPPPPPTGVDCPKDWSWDGPKKCCLPHHPPPPKPPVPQCPKGWVWWPILHKCLPIPSPPKPHPPQPSKPPHGPQPPKPPHNPQPPKPPHNPHDPKPPHNPHDPKPPHYGKREETSRIALCPAGLRACPLSGLLAGEYECLDTTTELTSCGGCVSEGKGQDCTSIKGAWNVGCERGSCAVYSCSGGFKLSDDKKSCVPL